MGKKNKQQKLPNTVFVVMEQDVDGSCFPLCYTNIDMLDDGMKVGTYQLVSKAVMRVARVLDDTRVD